MAKPLVSDALWERIAPLFPPPKPRRYRYPGRQPLDRRTVLTGILVVLTSGIPWEMLPQEMGCGSGMSCLNYLKAWHKAGVWTKRHRILLQELEDGDRIDWSRGAADATFARAPGGGEGTGKNPTERGKLGSKHPILTDANGLPLNVTTTGANVPEVKERVPLVDSAPAVETADGTPRHKPEERYGDRAYDSAKHRQTMRNRNSVPHFARRNTEPGSGLGVYRWVGERTASRLHTFRRRRRRTDRNGDVQDAFVALASSLIGMWFL